MCSPQVYEQRSIFDMVLNPTIAYVETILRRHTGTQSVVGRDLDKRVTIVCSRFED